MPSDFSRRTTTTIDKCQYGQSKLVFRGPKRSLGDDYIAFLGGSETYGRNVQQPFPEVIEQKLGVTCVNLGWPNAGIEVLLNDPALIKIASGAVATVLQVPGAVNLNTRYYKVHPRRNDRFIEAHQDLRDLFPTVDFTEFSFTRHMLSTLKQVSPVDFLHVQAELAAVWTDGMRRLIRAIGTPVVLLWLADRKPNEIWDRPDHDGDPVMVSREMIEAVYGDANGYLECDSRTNVVGGVHKSLATRLLDRVEDRMRPGRHLQSSHNATAEVIYPTLRTLVDKKRRPG